MIQQKRKVRKTQVFILIRRDFTVYLVVARDRLYHKETKTVKENDKVTTNTVVDKRNLKFGGRNVSPDKILKLMRQIRREALKFVARDGTEEVR